MKARKVFLTTTFTLLFSSAAFAGTWQTGSGSNQDKWWYDNGDGTYAQNGWQWIDGNDDGVSECYYFDADGWMYADTTTPDNCQVNSSGAWVENGIVKTQSAAPLQNWFEAAGLQANVFLNHPADYVTTTYAPATFKTTGQLTFYAYQTMELNDGYEWKNVSFDLSFNETNALDYGVSWAYTIGNQDFIDLVNNGDGREQTFTLNFNGKEYTNCKIISETETFSEYDYLYLNGYLTCCVPKGYHGMYIAFYDSALYSQIMTNGEAEYISALKNALIFSLY
ncbi:MAG: hypothetical protein HFG51_05925 [Lachnospiraceae bacterium]|nr:hypothetical protein [Lachnospiraceae bacterium]